MRVSTVSMLLGAAACAAAAALLTKSWLAGKPERPHIVAQQLAPPATKTVIVAATPLKFGVVLSHELLSEVAWPAASVPTHAFASKDALLAGGQRVVLAAIAQNEPILASKITGSGQRASLSVMIEEGKNAVTIRVDDVLGVAGFVQPEDRVDVLLTRNERGMTGNKSTSESAYTDLLLQNIRVLAIDQFADRNTQAKPVKAVTLEVETADAQKLVLAASIGQLSLALRRAGWSSTSDARRIGIEHLPLSPPAEAAQPPRKDEPTDRGLLVTIIRGTGERKQYDVSPDASRSALAEPIASGSSVEAKQARRGEPRGDEPPIQTVPR